MSVTHEQYIESVRDLAIARLNSPAQAELLRRAKLVYGYGHSRSRRGVTCYGQWAHPDHDMNVELVEICASGEEGPLQLAGTTLHELAHVLAGIGSKHGPEWKEMCHILGLRKATATSTDYSDEGVWDLDMLAFVTQLEAPADGKPTTGIGVQRTGKGGCSTGQKKQTARLRLWQCKCEPKPIKIRVAKDELQVMCMECGTMFKQPEDENGNGNGTD